MARAMRKVIYDDIMSNKRDYKVRAINRTKKNSASDIR